MEGQAKVVAEIVRDALGETPKSVEHVPTLEDSTVFRIELSSGRVFFKNEHEGHSIEMSAWAYEKARSAGVPAPDVLHLDTSRERWPDEFIVISALTGTDLQNDPLEGPALHAVLEEVGALFKKLHSVTLDGYGDLERGPEGEVRGQHVDHASYVRARPAWGLPYAIRHDLVDRRTVERIEDILANHEAFAPYRERGSLVHGDLGLDHVFVERATNTITGLLDFEAECVDPMVDLARFRYHYPDLSEHVLRGYGEVPDDIDVRCDLYGLLQAIGSLRWEHERGFDDYLARAQREIARVTERL